MRPLPDLLILGALTVLGTGLFLSVLLARYRGAGFIGKPSTQPMLFYTSKLSIFFSIGFLLGKALYPDFGGIHSPDWLIWPAVILVILGSMMLLISFFTMGKALKYGLPEEETHLITNGIFALSRNPLYVGLFMVNIGSVLYNPCILNLLFSGYCIGSHIWLILGEERFLETRFGEEWKIYKKRVRRFL